MRLLSQDAQRVVVEERHEQRSAHTLLVGVVMPLLFALAFYGLSLSGSPTPGLGLLLALLLFTAGVFTLIWALVLRRARCFTVTFDRATDRLVIETRSGRGYVRHEHILSDIVGVNLEEDDGAYRLALSLRGQGRLALAGFTPLAEHRRIVACVSQFLGLPAPQEQPL